jgi:[ribosomal protein S18]-alanine N-acetyltransferase
MFSEEASPICFRRARSSDLPALVRLEAATFDLHRIDRRHFARLLQSSSVYCGVLESASFVPSESGDAVVAYGLVFLRRGKTRARLYSLAVSPAFRGKGLGTELVERLMNALAGLGQSRMSLEVRAEDAPAVRFYERLGFRLMERLPGYYDDGAEALRLVIALPEMAQEQAALAG